MTSLLPTLLPERLAELLADGAWPAARYGALAPLNVAEVGCGEGERCRLWAARGHRVFGVDHDRERIVLARARAFEAQLEIMFDLACGSALPWPDRSMDLCLAPALPDCASHWRACLDEMGRVLRPGATLLLGSGAHTRRFVRRD
jgi:ubiquinone/menaquinone biosynthesis C-methylase UbiE